MNESTALQKKPDNHSYTYVPGLFNFGGMWNCDDCGAYGHHKETIVHHETCVPGESERWMQSYNDAPDEEEAGVLEEEEEYGGQ